MTAAPHHLQQTLWCQWEADLATPSASATALAMHGGVLIEFPSATPFAPSGVTGDWVS